MSDTEIEDYTLVYYHGSLKKYHGFALAFDGDEPGRYTLELISSARRPFDQGQKLYNTRRLSFTAVPVPEINSLPTEPGEYQSKSNRDSAYKLDDEGTWYVKATYDSNWYWWACERNSPFDLDLEKVED